MRAGVRRVLCAWRSPVRLPLTIFYFQPCWGGSGGRLQAGGVFWGGSGRSRAGFEQCENGGRKAAVLPPCSWGGAWLCPRGVPGLLLAEHKVLMAPALQILAWRCWTFSKAA